MLALALFHVERFLGSGFVFNPDRWPTADGYLPYRVCLVAGMAIASVRAGELLGLSQTTMLPHQKESDRAEVIARFQRLAQPGGPVS